MAQNLFHAANVRTAFGWKHAAKRKTKERAIYAKKAITCCDRNVLTFSGTRFFKCNGLFGKLPVHTRSQKTTPSRWTATYETPWRTIEVDVPVEIPDVDSFPVFRVTRTDKVDDDLLSNYSVEENKRGYLWVCFNYQYANWQSTPSMTNKVQGTFLNGETPDIQPERNDMTYEDALDFCYSKIEEFFSIKPDRFRIDRVDVYGGYYEYDGHGETKTYLEHVYGDGEWSFVLKQDFDGIPMDDASTCYKKWGFPNESDFVESSVVLEIVSEDSYSFKACLFDILDKPHSDVPIYGFSDAKKAFEEEIFAGHLRTVDEVKLCYIPYYEKGDKKILWLLPAWVAKGGYTRNAKKEFTPSYDDDRYVDDGMEHIEVVYEANKGTLIQYDDMDKSRRAVPQIVTWDELQK